MVTKIYRYKVWLDRTVGDQNYSIMTGDILAAYLKDIANNTNQDFFKKLKVVRLEDEN